jgi:hypothetical protein
MPAQQVQKFRRVRPVFETIDRLFDGGDALLSQDLAGQFMKLAAHFRFGEGLMEVAAMAADLPGAAAAVLEGHRYARRPQAGGRRHSWQRPR